ncbi:MAG: metal-dependent hydrolase, partial [Odoribacter sp.]|nr:metal-dependent hydrolase [Odoribacter sp.]
MMGSTHKAVGVVAGLILAVCGVIHSEYIMIVMLFVVPAGAMLPDIDHNSSKLGRERKKVVAFGQKFLSGAGVGICVYGAITSLIASKYSKALLYILAVTVLLVLFVFLQRSEWAKKQLKFFTKHRGIMHTLIIPGVLIWLVVSVVMESAVRVVLMGLA